MELLTSNLLGIFSGLLKGAVKERSVTVYATICILTITITLSTAGSGTDGIESTPARMCGIIIARGEHSLHKVHI